jgi:hypothetical protein
MVTLNFGLNSTTSASFIGKSVSDILVDRSLQSLLGFGSGNYRLVNSDGAYVSNSHILANGDNLSIETASSSKA